MRRRAWMAVVLAAGLLPAWSGGVEPARNAARELGDAFADAVERVMPAVVVVRTEGTVLRPARDLFFGDLYGIPKRLAGQGSGVIITSEGHVLTSDHVIESADEVEVVLHDGEKYAADIVGRDPVTDLAVLKIRAPGDVVFPPVEPGDSDRLRVGEFVIAMGSPFSLDSSVTAGIVSQKGRNVGLLPYEDFIQTDAPINPGSSGGPLVDVDGRMVGINAVIQTGGPFARGNIGIGFAVPANVAMRIARSIIRTGRAERPWLGIRLQELEHLRTEPPGERVRGAVVSDVIGNTPAAKVGVRAGDIITAVDEEPVGDVRAVQRRVFVHEVGDVVNVDVLRDGRRMVFEIVTEQMPDLTVPGR